MTDSKTKKAIEPELISSKWQEHGEYHHYGDWKKMMQECFDQFNLMELKPAGPNHDFADHQRRVPKGIFPQPNKKRVVLENAYKERAKTNHADRFSKFEKDPSKFLLEQELQISKSLKPLTPEVSLIANLQNLKHGLLANYSDADICKQVLLGLSITDALIEEHLSQSAAENTHLLPRDPSEFRKY